MKREGASTTLYLAPDFEVRDGLATTYVKAGHTNVARVEEPAFAATFFPDVAPLGAGAAAEPAPDGVITAADAWVVQAAKSGLVDLPPPAGAKAKTADVDKMLASAARRMLGADATQTTYGSHDHLGSPSLETNERGGVVARRWHGPYGEVRGASGAWAEARGFTGKERDETTGLADHGARYLDTRLGRWTAPDPLAVRELGGAELDVYGYVEGRVTAATDPTGYEGVEVRARQRELKNFSAVERKQVAAMQGRVLETAVVVGAGGFACASVPALCTALGRIGAVGYLATSASLQEASEKALAIAEAEVGARIASSIAAPIARGVVSATRRSLGAVGAPLGRVRGSFDAVTPGPLADDLAATFAGGRYQEIVLEADTILYRAGQAGRPLGQFFDKSPPSSVIQARIDKAILPRWPGGSTSPIDSVFEVKIPAGTRVYAGEVGSQGGAFVGGTQQIVVPRPWTIEGVEVVGSSALR